jgi:hypothetical protein
LIACLDHDRALDRLPRRAVDAAEDDVDPVLLDELRRDGGCDLVVGRAVLEVQLEPAPEQAALRVDVADDHPRDVGVREADDRERAGLVGDDAHLDGTSVHRVSLRSARRQGPKSSGGS